MRKQVINPEAWGAPFPGFSQAYLIDFDGCRMVIISGQIALDGEKLVGEENLERQIERCWERIQEIVRAAGGEMSDVVETHTYMLDITQLSVLARVRAKFLGDPPPTSTVVQVSALASAGALVAIDATAAIAR